MIATSYRAARAIALAGPVLLIGASTAISSYFGWLTGSAYHWTLGVIFLAAFFGGDILKPVAVKAAFDAFREGRIGIGIAAAAVACVCLAGSFSSDLGLSATGRGDMAAERSAASLQAGNARAARARYVAELSALKASRPLAELDALVAAAPTRCRVYVSSGRRQTVCSKDARLLAEHGRAKRRADLERKIAAVDGQAGVAEKAADPLATAAAFYLAAAGYQIPAGDLSVWLYLVPVLLIQIGSAFGLVVAGNDRARVAATASVAGRVETVSGPPMATLSGLEKVASKRFASPVGLGDGRHVIDALRASQRPLTNAALARAMGVTPGEATKRRARVAHLLDQVRDGRELRIRLAATVH
jgi:hypothetical protein